MEKVGKAALTECYMGNGFEVGRCVCLLPNFLLLAYGFSNVQKHH